MFRIFIPVIATTLFLSACKDTTSPDSTAFKDAQTAEQKLCKADRDFTLDSGDEFGSRSIGTLKSAFKAAAMKDFDAFMATAADPYIQHSPDLPDGWKPVWDLLVDRPEGFSSKQMPWLGEGGFLVSGNFLVMLREVDRRDGTPPSKIIDLMKFDDEGKYAEHWDIRQAISKSTASGRSETGASDTFDNNPVNYDEKTERENAKVMVKFLNRAFNQGKLNEALDNMVDPGYIQHNPMIPDGTESVKQAFASGSIPALCYDIKYVLPQNDLVVVYSKVTSALGISAVIDIVRVRDGKLVEHWDVVQAVPAVDKMPHKNGMF